MMATATGVRTRSQPCQEKPGSGSGRCKVTRPKMTVISVSDVRQYGHAAWRIVSDTVVR